MARAWWKLSPLLLAACAQPSPPAPANVHPTIVSLNPCTDAILAEVAEPGQILALSSYSRDPLASSMDLRVARRFAATSGTVEEIAALRPDVVVSGTFVSPATRAALARLGLPLVEIPIAASVSESVRQVRHLAELAGRPAKGEALVRQIEQALAAAAAPSGRRVTAIVWQSGGIVPGENTLIADLLRKTGFANLSAARGMGQADLLPLEQMLADPPQVILAAGDGPSGENRMLQHPALASVPETRRERLDPALLWCGGPTIVRAAARLGEIRGRFVTNLHPARM